MTTTALPTTDAAAPAADRAGWAVPGLGPDPATSGRPAPGDDATGGSGGSGDGPGGGASGHPIVVAMAACLESLDSVRGVSATTLSATEIRLMLLAVVQIIAAATALKLRLLVAAEVHRVRDLTGARSTPAFLAHLTQTTHATASAETRLARDLDERFELLADALAAGRLSPEHTRIAVAALRRLPRDLDADQWQACQRLLIDAAQRLSPPQLRRIGRRLWEIADPDAAEAKLGQDLEEEEELARAKAYFKSWRNGDGTTSFKGRLPDLHATILLKAVHALASPRRRSNPHIRTGQPDDRSPEERQTGRTIPYPVRLGHALMDLLERLPTDILPANAGVTALVRITLDHDKLQQQLGAASIDTDTDLSPAQTRRLACNAGIIPVVLGGRSEPLDMGRARRLHTRAQREALDHRDGQCTADGCTVPAAWTEVHHHTAWQRGGRTTVADASLLCSYHHHLAHSSRWAHRRVDGVVRFSRIRR